MILEGDEDCPALTITDESRWAYEMFWLAYSEMPGGPGQRSRLQRHITFLEMLNLPNWLTEAFRTIETEIYYTQAKR